jgi:hypothetical protein
MTHLWIPGQPITVKSDPLGSPLWFRWQGQRHGVERVCDRWRVDDDWWKGRVWREYFKLATRRGLLVVVYRDFLTNRWFLQRAFD